jgi:phage terminase large subunit
VCWTTYKDNKFLTEDDRKALEDLQFIDEYTYEVYCLGKWGILGKTVFDARAIQKRLDEIPRPIKRGYFVYDYDGLEISNIRWVNDRDGYIKIYAVPTLTKYCIGGDTSGDGSDFFTGHVLDARTGVQVATLKHQFDADQYTKQMFCLGKYYNDALIGIEANFDSFPIMELQRLGYENQYAREAQDTYTGKVEKRFGFKTTSLTRPTVISRLIEIVREHCDTINDQDTLEELLTIVRNEKGRIEAPQGGHDDQMMGLAIAHQIREQVTIEEDVVYARPHDPFGLFNTYRDDGDDITVI